MTQDPHSRRNVIIAYDDSSADRLALAHVAERVRPGDVVTIVNVMPEPGVGSRLEPPTAARNRQWRLLDEARRFLAARGIEAHTQAPVGDVVAEVLAAAELAEADLIVVGRHRGHVPHPLGSISARISRAAPCDVLIVHEPAAVVR